jgi:hypothetical protein
MEQQWFILIRIPEAPVLRNLLSSTKHISSGNKTIVMAAASGHRKQYRLRWNDWQGKYSRDMRI